MTTKLLQQRMHDPSRQRGNVSLAQTQLIRLTQLRGGGDPCYLSDKRYNCTEKCEWSLECRKLRAKWVI